MSNSTATPPILALDKVRKIYTRGLFKKETTFSLEANISFPSSSIVGLMGANGAGKTTLFELMTGGNLPTDGKVFCMGKDIHQVKYDERDRLAIHYHQSYQVRKIKRTKPNFLLEPSNSSYPVIHLFDEPQFNTQDGYIGFMLDFFKQLREAGRLVFICLHPMEHYHLDIMKEICESFLFLGKGELSQYGNWQDFTSDKNVKQYLGAVLESYT